MTASPKDWTHSTHNNPKASRNRKLFRSIFDRKDKDTHNGTSSQSEEEKDKDEGWLRLRRGRSSRGSSRPQSQVTSRTASTVRDGAVGGGQVHNVYNTLTGTSAVLSSRPTPVVGTTPEDTVRTILLEQYKISPESIELDNIRFVLGSKFAQNDQAKAVQLIVAFKKASEGLMHPYISSEGRLMRLTGADNWNGVSCYFDSLMVAMFARMDNFEPMLYKNFEFDERRETLATLLRFYVTLLRQGCLITTDVTHKLMESLMEAGWCDSQSLHRQQDVSELFQFICDKMDMPLLTLKVDIAHGGKEVLEDDHKLVNERMLHIPVPGTDSDPPILLEQCLELYFANSVHVKRQLERRKTLDQLDPVVFKKATNKSKRYHVHVETVELLEGEGGSPTTLASRRTSSGEWGDDPDRKDVNTLKELQFVDQNRWASIEDLAEDDPEVEDPETSSIATMVKNRRISELRKGSIDSQSTRSSLWNENSEITLPAWMFLQLLPFYSNKTGDAGSPAAVYFAKSKPVLVICLKRFCWTEEGQAIKNNRTVVIPDTIHFPSFVADENLDMDYDDSEEAVSDEDYTPLRRPGPFKLVLESAVCHRGNSIHSGHYITLVSEQAHRKTVGEYTSVNVPSNNNAPGARHRFRTRSGTVSSRCSISSESSRRRWLRFDDFQTKDNKFQQIDFEDAFTQESPYLLFYRMVADSEEEEDCKNYVQPVPDCQNKPVECPHRPSIGNIDMNNGSGKGAFRANFGIGDSTTVGVTEVSCDCSDSEDEYHLESSGKVLGGSNTSISSNDVSPTNTNTAAPSADHTRPGTFQMPLPVDSPETHFFNESAASSICAQPLDSESDAEPHLGKSKSYSSIMSFWRRDSNVTPVPEHAELPSVATVPEGVMVKNVSTKKRFFLKKLASHSSEDETRDKEIHKEGQRKPAKEKRKDKGKDTGTARSSLDDEDREWRQYRDEKCVIS